MSNVVTSTPTYMFSTNPSHIIHNIIITNLIELIFLNNRKNYGQFFGLDKVIITTQLDNIHMHTVPT